MELHSVIDRASLDDTQCLAESGEFALYARDRDSYLMVQKHRATSWSGFSVSGDGVFRIASLLVDAMRHLYRDVASDVTVRGRARRPEDETPLS
ncbi:MAG: hypothetical protein M3Z14_06410 [Candidatus Eremiobacteraeota bacterium]|nr:hypothetical protein [Candidatus Eremiobacteraeota bacterium]